MTFFAIFRENLLFCTFDTRPVRHRCKENIRSNFRRNDSSQKHKAQKAASELNRLMSVTAKEWANEVRKTGWKDKYLIDTSALYPMLLDGMSLDSNKFAIS